MDDHAATQVAGTGAARPRTVAGHSWRAICVLGRTLTRALTVGLGVLGGATGRPPETLLPPDPLPPPRRRDYRP